MELIRASERVWYYPFERERDRPIPGYVKGDKLSIAVDAGHSGGTYAGVLLRSEKSRLALRIGIGNTRSAFM